MSNDTVLLQLTRLYRVFYRANARNESSNQSVIKPLLTAKEAILQCRFTSLEELTQVISARLNKTLFSITVSNADGYTLIEDFDTRNKAVEEFARYYVKEVFCWYLHSNKASLNTELDVLEDTVAHLYRIEQMKETDLSQVEGIRPKIKSTSEYNIEYSITLKDNDDVLIILGNLLEITLNHFSAILSVNDEIQVTDLHKRMTVSYPLDGDYNGLNLKVYTTFHDNEQGIITTHGRLWIGYFATTLIPYEFSKKLQHFLLTGELTND